MIIFNLLIIFILSWYLINHFINKEEEGKNAKSIKIPKCSRRRN